jgi:hypothetical protein
MKVALLILLALITVVDALIHATSDALSHQTESFPAMLLTKVTGLNRFTADLTPASDIDVLQILPAPEYIGTASVVECKDGTCRPPNLWNPVPIGSACINVEVWGVREDRLQHTASGYASMKIEGGGVLHTTSKWSLSKIPRNNILAYHERYTELSRGEILGVKSPSFFLTYQPG